MSSWTVFQKCYKALEVIDFSNELLDEMVKIKNIAESDHRLTMITGEFFPEDQQLLVTSVERPGLFFKELYNIYKNQTK